MTGRKTKSLEDPSGDPARGVLPWRDLGTLFAECISAGCDDYRLATLVRADGMARLGAGQRFGIEEYFAVLPDLHNREMTLDAVIDLSLGALVASGLTVAEAVRQLSSRHRDLQPLIARAAALTLIVENATTRRPTHRKQRAGKRVEWTEWNEERFELVRLLGRGSFADVMLARDRQGAPGADLVALKILRRTGSQAGRELFMDEAAKTRRVNHPNVMRVLDMCEAGAEWPWIAFEHLDGGTLAIARAQMLDQIGPSGVVRLLESICRGVQAIHEAGLVHCDIKPANILLTSGLTPKVADLGVAVSVQCGPDNQGDHPVWSFGTLGFMAPEQLREAAVKPTPAADIYALGGLLAWALTGEVPNGASWVEIAADVITGAHRHQVRVETRLASLSPDLATIWKRASQASPSDRYPSAATLAEELSRWNARTARTR